MEIPYKNIIGGQFTDITICAKHWQEEIRFLQPMLHPTDCNLYSPSLVCLVQQAMCPSD